MRATRTQVYLTQEQRARLDELIQREHVSLAHILREALNSYRETRFPRPQTALARHSEHCQTWQSRAATRGAVIMAEAVLVDTDRFIDRSRGRDS